MLCSECELRSSESAARAFPQKRRLVNIFRPKNLFPTFSNPTSFARSTFVLGTFWKHD